MIWTKERIVAELKALHKKKVDLSYNNLAKKKQALVSAAAYHFRSYRNAVEKAGINYEEIARRPRWTKPRVIATIKAALVVTYFMHLKWDKKFHLILFLTSVLFLILFISISLTDRSEYQHDLDAFRQAQEQAQ